jgi:adenine/guanine phosphoribosyltransferase-like PRPP-binding protein
MKRVAPEVKAVDTYISNLNVDEEFKDIIQVEHRSGNPKRDYLFVNRIQGKHIPCNPKFTISMCKKLASKVSEKLDADTKVLVIGFAETATAIGELVALNLPQAQYVMHTTRENVGKDLLEFQEEHSHATEQFLSVWDNTNSKDFINQFDYILFVEDEISTGNTILNFIKAFRSLDLEGTELKFGVASICNWQDESRIEQFKSHNIDRYYLISGELKDVNAKMNIEHKSKPIIINIEDSLRYFGFENERLGRKVEKSFMESDINTVVNQLEQSYLKTIPVDSLKGMTARVVGTEESMILPILVANELQSRFGISTICHSSSRSKIDVINSMFDTVQTGIKSRHNIPSMYDNDRKTYIYNLNKYTDMVILISDGKYTEDRIEDLPEFNTSQLVVVRVK